MRAIVIVLVLVTTLAPVLASDDGPFEPVDTVTLNDGSVLKGRIVEEDQSKIVLQTNVGRIEIPRTEIDLIERTNARGRSEFEGHPDPAANTIFFTPTPETIGSGGYFRNFLLFFLNWGFSIHEDVDLSVGTLFPVSTSFYAVSAGIKWRLASREDHPLGIALIANGNIVDDHRSGTVGGVIGIGDAERSLNFSVGRYAGVDDESATILLLGGDVRVGARTKFLFEVGTSSDVFDDEYDGLMNVGFRWYGERMSFSLTGFRPLRETGDFAFFPFTMFSMSF